MYVWLYTIAVSYLEKIRMLLIQLKSISWHAKYYRNRLGSSQPVAKKQKSWRQAMQTVWSGLSDDIIDDLLVFLDEKVGNTMRAILKKHPCLNSRMDYRMSMQSVKIVYNLLLLTPHPVQIVSQTTWAWTRLFCRGAWVAAWLSSLQSCFL